MDSGAGFSCALRYSRVPPQSKNASEPKVYRCGKPSVVPYQATDSLMSRTVREIWASGPRVSVVMAWILSCEGPNYPPLAVCRNATTKAETPGALGEQRMS